MGRRPRRPRRSENAGPNPNRRGWTAEEDMLLAQCVTIHGETGWTSISQKAGLMRSGKSCRLRWLNYLRPDIKHGNISSDEEELIIRMHGLLGNRWSLIAGRLPGRTDNEIKNYWHTHLAKKNLSNKNVGEKQKTKEKHALPAADGLLKVSPVKTKALRISKGLKTYVGSGSSNHQTTDRAKAGNASNTEEFNLPLEEFMKDRDFDITDCRMLQQLGSPSVEINGQFSPEDFRLDAFQGGPGNYLDMYSLYYNMDQFENFAEADYYKMEGIYDSKQDNGSVDELQYLQL
ncbi:hypothetical protein SUGI_0715120 [Cryptomeria japonica]|uniref:transcription factor MYB1-like n=1 Tax=Cryptomeria japonica TaxID=3369 RepID=UPI002414BA26|nr:transcription factor MYB1-like [Cryptomeria japonica]GLJ35573.1 hypothetical protein SUGI_0715120 [Cryptomeria japonica]